MDPEIVLLLTQLMEIDADMPEADQCDEPVLVAQNGPGVVAKDTFFAGTEDQDNIRGHEPMFVSHVEEPDDASAHGQAAAMLMYYHLVGCGISDQRQSERERRHLNMDKKNKDHANN